ncbi:hypothetical protein V1477_002284 [Vespula maculifrons]|uniref:Uncharacterized protein n=1 Tax=Vespula maculifrons TaxID=7453 RepID=A0ABD2CX71_VESMC
MMNSREESAFLRRSGQRRRRRPFGSKRYELDQETKVKKKKKKKKKQEEEEEEEEDKGSRRRSMVLVGASMISSTHVSQRYAYAPRAYVKDSSRELKATAPWSFVSSLSHQVIGSH